jgi:hypothetical protein
VVGNQRSGVGKKNTDECFHTRPQISLTRVKTYQRITVNELCELNEFELIRCWLVFYRNKK